MGRFRSFLPILLCLLMAISVSAQGLGMDCDEIYCFAQEDFGQSLKGICVMSLPDTDTGTMLLGSRVVQPGDILTAEQLSALRFAPLLTEDNKTASISYLPIYEDSVGKETVTVFSIRGKEDHPPVAEDSSAETYKNLPSEGNLKVSDPEGQPMRYTIVRQPKRGTVEIREDGSFVYTPKRNKVGVDSFVYTASDPAGNVSREATVSIRILRPSDSRQYTDTVNESCRYVAEWLKNEGIFTGEEVAGQLYFHPQKQVTRGEFLAMTMRALQIPVEETPVFGSLYGSAADYFVPTLSAAMRCGILAGLPQNADYGENEPITGAEAAVMLQNILQLASTEEPLANVDGITTFEEDPLSWASEAMAVMAENGITLTGAPLTRGEAAEILHRACALTEDAPGIRLFR